MVFVMFAVYVLQNSGYLFHFYPCISASGPVSSIFFPLLLNLRRGSCVLLAVTEC